MEKTVKDLLVDVLEDLGGENLKRFRNKLCDRKDKPRVSRVAAERAGDALDLADLIISTFTESEAVTVTAQVLTSINCNQAAMELNKATAVTNQVNVAPGHQPDAGNQHPSGDVPDTASALIPSSVQFKEEILREKGDEIYSVLNKNERKRLALLINNVEFDCKDMRRNGALEDEENMQKLLKGLGYEVVKFRNLSGQDMEEKLKNFAGREEHAKSDSTFVVIMSHGKRDAILGVHYGPNNQDSLSVDKIYSCLDTAHCPGLRNKPKVILIQACRGGEDGRVWVADAAPDEPWSFESDKWEHKEKDFISLLSCTPDTKSYRHPRYGTLFIGFIVEVFNASAHCDHIEELFRQVMRRIERVHSVRQMVCKDRTTLIKNFYLFPGL